MKKQKIVHFRNKRRRKTKFEFKIDNCTLDIDNSYRYLGVIFDEHLDIDKCAKTLSDAAGRALGSIITKFKQFKNIGYKTFTKLYNSGVSSILDYGAKSKSKLGFNVPFNSQGHIGTGPQHCHLWDSNPQR